MEKNTEACLMKLAREKARAIREQTRIPGWHEDESRFPESDYKAVLAMLEEAYRLGRNASEQDATRKHKALIDGLTEQAEWNGGSERGTMESLLDIFEPEELVKLGYGGRVKAYFEEYGGDGDWEDIRRKAAEHDAV